MASMLRELARQRGGSTRGTSGRRAGVSAFGVHATDRGAEDYGEAEHARGAAAHRDLD